MPTHKLQAAAALLYGATQTPARRSQLDKDDDDMIKTPVSRQKRRICAPSHRPVAAAQPSRDEVAGRPGGQFLDGEASTGAIGEEGRAEGPSAAWASWGGVGGTAGAPDDAAELRGASMESGRGPRLPLRASWWRLKLWRWRRRRCR